MLSRSSFRATCALVAALVVPASAAGQVGSAAAGALLGTAGGAYLSLALTTAAARAGHFAFSPSQGLWRAVPIPVGAVAGGLVGYQGRDELRDVVRGGLVGLAVGTVLGAAVARLAWGEPEDVWSGGIVAGGVGLLVGSLWGGLHHGGRGGDERLVEPAFTIMIPFSP